MILDNLEELRGKPLYTATIAYLSPQEWGIFLHVDGTVESTKEKAEDWLAQQSEARVILWLDVGRISPIYDLDTLTTKAVSTLQVEKRHCQEKMQKELERYDDRIAKLKAITYQPAPQQPKGYSHSEKVTFVQGVIQALDDVLPRDETNAFAYVDEEGETTIHYSLSTLYSDLWQCDQEWVRFYLPEKKVVTLALVWDNPAPEVLSDYSWPADDEEIQQLVANTLSNVVKEFGYDDDIPF